jgi:hypothetical protein
MNTREKRERRLDEMEMGTYIEMSARRRGYDARHRLERELELAGADLSPAGAIKQAALMRKLAQLNAPRTHKMFELQAERDMQVKYHRDPSAPTVLRPHGVRAVR